MTFEKSRLQQLYKAADKCLKAGEFEQAVRICQEIRAIDPQDASANYLMGLTAHKQGRHGEARLAKLGTSCHTMENGLKPVIVW